MVDIRAGGGVIRIGRVQENEYRRVLFDVADVLRDYPDAVFTVMNQRIQDTEAYPVPSAQLSVEGGALYWTLKAGDLAYEGVGRCEVIARSGSVVAKSAVWFVWVEEALDGNAEPPAPWEGWVEQVTEAAERAEAAAQLLENPGAEAVTLEAGSQATAEYEDGTFTFGIPRGPKGEDGADGADGYSPSAVVSKSGGVATVTITDKDGTTTAEIRDGTDGQDGITPAFSIGTVQKGTNAAATITGTPAAPVLNLTLPKGDKGNTGNTGPTGATPEFSIGTVETGAAGSQAAATITGTAEAPVLNLTIPRGDKGETGEVSEAEMTAAIAAASSELKSEIDRKAPVILQTASGDIVTVTDGADGMPLSSCVVQIDPVQSGTGDPSPENIRSISGRDSGTIYRTGALVSDSLTVVQGYYDADGIAKSSAGMRRTSNYIPSVPGMSYMIVGTTDSDASLGSRVRVHEYDSNQTWLRQVYVSDGIARVERVCKMWTASTDAVYYRLSWPKFTTEDPVKIYTKAAQYPITWQTAAGTVYGGTLDTVTGVLTVDRILLAIDGTTKQVVFHKTGSAATAFRYGASSAESADGTKAQISNYLHKASQDQTANGKQELALYANGTNVYMTLTESITTAEAANAYFVTNPLQIVYYLSTPLTYQLDPVQIKTLMGYNALWSDTGAVAVTYPADTQTYVDSAITAATDPNGNVVTVSGSTPSITGESGKRYVCGTVDSISITPPQTGIIDVVFTSGTTPTVLTVPGTVKFPAWFDATSLDASTKYEINIMDGTDGAVMAWQT